MMNRYTLGLVSISFRSLSPGDILKAMADAGLTCVEWGSDVHAPADDLCRLEEIIRLQRRYGITCSAYGTYFRLGVTPLEELPAYIRAAKLLGTDILRLWCGDRNSEDYDAEGKQALFAACRDAAKLAEQAGVTLCMECHNNTYTNRARTALELMEAVASAAFGMYWQPNQYRTVEENLEYARLLAPYTRHLHVFNWEGKSRFPLEEGLAVWQRYLSCFTGERTLLLEFMPDNAPESLPAEARALRALAEQAS